jgi:hypothetical protein
MTSSGIVKKLWNYRNIEQLTFLLFLKMADERQKIMLLRLDTSV